jgi:thioredoxin-like negative regulator of GroEL
MGVVVAAGIGLLAAQRGLAFWQKARRRQALANGPTTRLASGVPQLLVFTGTLCADCLVQKDIVDRLRAQRPIFDTREVTAARAPELTRRFRIESVPATVLIDASGQALAVNYGLADEPTLSRQLDALTA